MTRSGKTFFDTTAGEMPSPAPRTLKSKNANDFRCDTMPPPSTLVDSPSADPSPLAASTTRDLRIGGYVLFCRGDPSYTFGGRLIIFPDAPAAQTIADAHNKPSSPLISLAPFTVRYAELAIYM